MPKGYVKAGSFQSAYNILQTSRVKSGLSFSSGALRNWMSEWTVTPSMVVENVEDPTETARRQGNLRTAGKRHSAQSSSTDPKDPKSRMDTSRMAVTVSMETLGFTELSQAFGAITDNVRRAAFQVLLESAGRIQAQSQKEVPYKSGLLHDAWYPKNLEEAVYTDKPDEFKLEVGYDTSQQDLYYGWVQHEQAFDHPVIPERSGNTPKDHYLSDPAEAERMRMIDTAMGAMRAAIASMGGVGVAVPTTSGYMGVLTKKTGPMLPKLRKKGA